MATAPTIKPYIARHPNSGAETSILNFPEAAGQTFKEGELVSITAADGLLTVATDAGLVAASEKLAGIALSDASGVANTSIPVMMFDAHTQVIINAKQAASADHVLAATDRGATCAIQVASNVWTLNTADTTGGTFTIVDVHPNYAVGDTNAWVYAQPSMQRILLGGVIT